VRGTTGSDSIGQPIPPSSSASSETRPPRFLTSRRRTRRTASSRCFGSSSAYFATRNTRSWLFLERFWHWLETRRHSRTFPRSILFHTRGEERRKRGRRIRKTDCWFAPNPGQRGQPISPAHAPRCGERSAKGLGARITADRGLTPLAYRRFSSGQLVASPALRSRSVCALGAMVAGEKTGRNSVLGDTTLLHGPGPTEGLRPAVRPGQAGVGVFFLAIGPMDRGAIRAKSYTE